MSTNDNCAMKVSTTFKSMSWARDHKIMRVPLNRQKTNRSVIVGAPYSFPESLLTNSYLLVIRSQYKGTTGKDIPIKDK